jgi:Wzt C-terminal domain
VALIGPEGEERRQFLADEALALRLGIVADRALDPPRLVFELRGESGLLLASAAQDTNELGWTGAPGELRLRFDVDRLPLLDGRFHLRLGLSDPQDGRLYHQLDEALSFVVYSEGDERGLVRLVGRWSREEIGARAEIPAR